MPVIYVHGLPIHCIAPADVDPTLKALRHNLQDAVASMPALHLRSSEVTVYFPDDLLPVLNSDVVIRVSLLYDQTERTAEARQKLCEKLVAIVTQFMKRVKAYDYCKLIEAFVDPPFRREQGYAQHEPKKRKKR